MGEMCEMIYVLEVGLTFLVIMSADILNGLLVDSSSIKFLFGAELVPVPLFVLLERGVAVLTERKGNKGSQEKSFDPRH